MSDLSSSHSERTDEFLFLFSSDTLPEKEFNLLHRLARKRSSFRRRRHSFLNPLARSVNFLLLSAAFLISAAIKISYDNKLNNFRFIFIF